MVHLSHPVVSLFLPSSYTRVDGVDIFDGLPWLIRIWSFIIGVFISAIAVHITDSLLVALGSCHYIRASDASCATMATGMWEWSPRLQCLINQQCCQMYGLTNVPNAAGCKLLAEASSDQNPHETDPKPEKRAIWALIKQMQIHCT